MTVELALIAALDALQINWQIYEHPAVFTVEESADLHADIPGAHTKNMFLKDAGGQFWLVTVPHHVRVDIKALPALVGGKKMSFGKAEDMQRLLGVAPGAVTPLAAINDSNGAVRVVLDVSLADAPLVNIHPLRNTATLALSGANLLRALTNWRHMPQVIQVPVTA
jgi:Ala-tRNA(Pro) deacylase